MNKQVWLSGAVAALALSAAPALAGTDTVNVFTIGSNPAGNALDPGGANIGGIPQIDWSHTLVGGGPVSLSIVAEGVDTGENDEVFFNGVSVGFLTQQGFASPLFNLNPGPGALAGVTALTTSVFDVSGLFVSGLNTVSVHVDPNNWVNEIETSTLSAAAVPEPLTWVLMIAGFGLAGGALRRRRTVLA